ncbi:T9SS type A sorting domain-containing protein, partial [Crocinitomix catalasitica]|nr:T9SS type A sorting domain-containing protein [Crocinitomix catalasitica]
FWEYDPISNTWSPIANFPSTSRRGCVTFSLGEYGFVGCGQGSIGSDFYAYHVPTGVWVQIADLPGPARSSSCGFSIDGKGYVGTGAGLSNDFFEYKPTTNTWLQKADVGPFGRAQAHGFAINGKGYIMGGLSSSPSGWNSQEIFEFDPQTNIWVQLVDFPGLGRRYPDGFEIGDKAYVGAGTNGTNLKDLWEFNPANALSVGNNKNITINAFPNPSSEYVIFDLGGASSLLNDDTELHLINLQGQSIVKRLVTDAKLKIDLTGFTSGTYLYVLKNKTKIVTRGKIQIVK